MSKFFIEFFVKKSKNKYNLDVFESIESSPAKKISSDNLKSISEYVYELFQKVQDVWKT